MKIADIQRMADDRWYEAWFVIRRTWYRITDAPTRQARKPLKYDALGSALGTLVRVQETLDRCLNEDHGFYEFHEVASAYLEIAAEDIQRAIKEAR